MQEGSRYQNEAGGRGGRNWIIIYKGLSALLPYPDRCWLNPVRDASVRYQISPVLLAESPVINAG